MEPVDKSRVLITSFWMDNINPEMRRLQKAVVDKFNPGYTFIQDRTNMPHGMSMDQIMKIATNSRMAQQGTTVIMIMDIDCLPLHPKALDYYIEKAWNGELVGNAQRSNHIQNDQHLYAGSPCVALSVETYNKLGQPSAVPSARGDVAEEWTYHAEEKGVPVTLVMPHHFDAPPIRMAWETDRRPFWPLKDGDEAHHYGIGTTYRVDGIEGDAMWHMFQSFHPGQLERFTTKCEEILRV